MSTLGHDWTHDGFGNWHCYKCGANGGRLTAPYSSSPCTTLSFLRVSDSSRRAAGPEGTERSEPADSAAPERGDAQTIAELKSEIDRLREGMQKCVDQLSRSQQVISKLADGPDRASWGEQLDRNDEVITSAEKNFNITPR